MKLGMCAYPWDVAMMGVEPFLDHLAELGVSRLYLASCYHSASLIAPRRQRQVALQAEANVAHLPLPGNTFSDLCLAPGQLTSTHPELFATLRHNTLSRGIEFFGWAVVFHNSALALGHPDVAWENCFGDRDGHGLCPANPRAARYAKDMARGLSFSGYFDGIMVESLSYLLAGHGHPHELFAVRSDHYLRTLQSLCFCPHCLEQGRKRGVDGTALRRRVAAQLTRSWNDPLGLRRDPDDGGEIITRMLLDDDFRCWLKLRCDVVNRLAEEVGEIIHRAGLRYEIASAVWGRPASFNWSEGIDIAASATLADRFLLACYYPTAGEVARELDSVLAYSNPARIGMLQTLWPVHHSSLSVLLDKVELAVDAGVTDITLYNYSMASEPLLRWVSAVAQLMRSKEEVTS